MTESAVGAPPAASLAIALSGGGHRASILATGALLAVVDRGLNTRVNRISSVSGGSITNAVVANGCDFSTVQPDEFYDLAETFVGRVRTKHLFNPLFIVLCAAVPATAVGVVLNSCGASTWVTIAAVILMVLLVLLCTGELLRAAINTVHFSATAPPRLESIQNNVVTHDFCATDLLTGMPIVFSSRNAEARRRVPVPNHPGASASQIWPIGHLQLAAVVRASAAFPGVAPKVIRFKAGHLPIPTVSFTAAIVPGTTPLRRLAIASDGGIWNNLGTQSMREEGGDNQPPIIAVNASALAKKGRALVYFIPGVALIGAIGRMMSILNRNTVEPRVAAIDRDLQRRHERQTSPNTTDDPLTVVADMRPVADARWTVARLGLDIVPPPAPAGRYAVARSELEALIASAWWTTVKAKDTDSLVTIGTKLSNVSKDDAFTLLLRGYVNTFLASLLIKPLVAEELTEDAGSSLVARLTKTAGL